MPPDQTPLIWVHPPQQARTQKSLARLLDAAEALLREKNFDDVHVTEIARRAGSSVASFYRRFPDKNALLYALHERLCEGALATAADVLHPDRWRGAEIKEILAAIFPFVVDIFKHNESLDRAFHQRALTDGAMRERSMRLRRHVMRGLSDLLLARRQEIRHPNPELAVSFSIVQALALLTEYYTVGLREVELVPINDEKLIAELTHSCLSYLMGRSKFETSQGSNTD